MKVIYFDDLFIIMHNDGYTLCEHVPYEQYNELLTVGLDQEYETPEHLIYSIIQSEDFIELGIDVFGISNNLSSKQ